MKRYAFLDTNGTVLNLIVGDLTPEQQEMFLHDHNLMYGAQQIIEITTDVPVWIGGSYTQGAFEPAPEPQPEPLPEPQPEIE
jgi:hypothetical protein